MKAALLVATLSLFSDQSPRYLFPPEPDPGEPVTVRLRAARGELTAADALVDGGTAIPLAREHADGGRFEYWRATIPSTRRYRFRYHGAHGDGTYGDFRLVPGFHPPAWSADAIHYQIFVDRFANGDTANDVRDGEYQYGGWPVTHRAWGERPESPTHCRDFYGGDLEGVAQKIDSYLKPLGVNALYLNPVFEAPSNHKYDTQDYRRVDPHFGGDAALAAVLAGGLRVTLDGVFNHAGSWHRWFDREHRYATDGAFESLASPWHGWFTFRHWPGDYVGWWGYSSLPKLDYSSAGLRREIYGDADSIVRHWLRAGASGWRLDVPSEIGEGGATTGNQRILAEIRRAARAARPDALVIGEIWDDPTKFLDDGDFDAVMNYAGFADPISRFLAGKDIHGRRRTLSPSALRQVLEKSRAGAAWTATLAMFNLIDSHDTSRFLWRAGESTAKLEMAATFQFAYPGAPVIYYGDEVGLSGGNDPDARRTFPWGGENHHVLEHYRRLARLRRERPVLARGSYLDLAADDRAGIFAFARFDGRDAAVAIFNPTTETRPYRLPAWRLDVADGRVFRDALSEEALTIVNGEIAGTLAAGRSALLTIDR